MQEFRHRYAILQIHAKWQGVPFRSVPMTAIEQSAATAIWHIQLAALAFSTHFLKTTELLLLYDGPVLTDGECRPEVGRGLFIPRITKQQYEGME